MNLPTAALVIVAGLAALLYPKAATQPLTFEQRWEPVKQLPAMVDHSPRELTFEERWEPVKPLIQLQHKMDRLEEELQPRVIPVRTIMIRSEVVLPEEPEPKEGKDKPDKGKVQEAPKKFHLKARVAALDVCQRYGMHKVMTNQGKSWRCRR